MRNELVKFNGIKVNIQNAQYYYDYFIDQAINSLIEFGINLIIYLFVYLTLVIQSIIVYFEEKGQEIAIDYILGISRIK